jgi:DNA-binding NarL/FixJ family response regulator
MTASALAIEHDSGVARTNHHGSMAARRYGTRSAPIDRFQRLRIWCSLAEGHARIVRSFWSGTERVFAIALDGQGHALSSREREILRLLGAGLANKEIAYELRLGRASVVRGVSALEQKLGLATRLELAVLGAALAPSDGVPISSVCGTETIIAGTRSVLVRASFDEHPAWASLSASQHEIVALLLSGCEREEIARRRGTSERTIANQVAGLFRKLGVSGKTAFATRLLAPAR